MPCVTATLLAEVGDAPTPDDEEDIKGLGCSVYGGRSSYHERTAVLTLIGLRRRD